MHTLPPQRSVQCRADKLLPFGAAVGRAGKSLFKSDRLQQTGGRNALSKNTRFSYVTAFILQSVTANTMIFRDFSFQTHGAVRVSEPKA